MKNPKTAAAALAAALCLVLACASVQVPLDADPEVRYYAVLADYNTAKGVALAFVESDASSIEQAEKILATVREADGVIVLVEQGRVLSDMDDAKWTRAADLIDAAARRLEEHAR